jgi:hypothetical protein
MEMSDILQSKIQRAFSTETETETCRQSLTKLQNELVFDFWSDGCAIVLDMHRADVVGFAGIFECSACTLCIVHEEDEDGTALPRQITWNGQEVADAAELAELITEFINV